MIPEDELNIPLEATLESAATGSTSSLWSLATISQGNSATIAISVETSIRSNPRCLIVGRQAKVADIRIQHGSISRKHAAFYLLPNKNAADNDSRKEYLLILEDFGSKKGTLVNGEPVGGKRPLQEGDEVIFGNVRESVFQVHYKETTTSNNNGHSHSTNEGNQAEKSLQTDNDTSVAPTHPEETKPSPEPGAGLTGRAKREAEIAAMMESLEQTPTYQKFVPSAEDIAPRSNTDSIGSNKSRSFNQETPLITSDNAEDLDHIKQTSQQYKLPILERMTMDAGDSNERKHSVTCIALDPSGARFMVGTTDNTLRLYDFGGMDRLRRDPFKMLQADEGHVVSDMCYSNTGDRIIVGTGSVQPYVLDRDGGEIIKFVRGDMYVVDQSKTTGHTAAVTGVDWHPLERDIVLTSSNDGSARLWNLNGKTQFQMLMCDKVFQPKSERGQRTGVNSVAFHPGGREFAVGTSCGSVQIWNTARVSGRPERVVYDAHGFRKPVNAIVYSVDGSRLATRSMDDTACKVWDQRRLSRSASPLAVCSDSPTLYEHCKPAFNADGTILCVGTSRLLNKNVGKRGEVGGVKFYHIPRSTSSSMKDPLDAILDLDATFSAGVTVACWHSKLNQIFLGCSDGKAEILFDPALSRKGALLPFAKAGRQSDGLSELLRSRAPTGSAGVRGQIIAPNALPIGQGTKRKREKEREDPSKSRQPEAPGAGFKTGGTQSGAAVNFTQFVVDSRIGVSKEIAGKDPREELLKYREGKSYISQAYVGNKEVILAEKTVEEEEEEHKTKK